MHKRKVESLCIDALYHIGEAREVYNRTTAYTLDHRVHLIRRGLRAALQAIEQAAALCGEGVDHESAVI